MELKADHFQQLSRKALKDSVLQAALRNIGIRFKAARDLAFSQLENPEELRQRGWKIKKETLERLDEYLEHLEKKVLERGGKLYWARTARQARRLIENLALEKGVKSVVKGKSMVTEEISLNESLKGRGIDVYETDLGEFIIQLAGEPPSHILGPAIHKTREQIADLFAAKLGMEKSSVPEDLTKAARKALRAKFLGADMGITGANFAIAETGSIVLLENEGNIRMSTTMPKIHVAIMGIEKVIPTLEDLGVLIKLLARSATGQKLSSYLSVITGSRREDEWDGAQEFHLILLDNGRTRILADEELRETLFCIRCGACLNVCPVYQKIGGHSYGWVYSGPIGSILTPQLMDRKKSFALPYASTLCGACAEVCPVKIDIPRILVALRKRLVEDPRWGKASPWTERIFLSLWAFVMENRWAYEAAGWMARILQAPFVEKGRIRRLPPPVNRWSRYHTLPAMQKRPFRQLWNEKGS